MEWARKTELEWEKEAKNLFTRQTPEGALCFDAKSSFGTVTFKSDYMDSKESGFVFHCQYPFTLTFTVST